MYSPTSGPQGPDAYPSLRDRCVIVTGGGQGLGRAMTLALAERGANVVANAARGPETLAELEALAKPLPGEVATLVADIRDPEDCARIVAVARDRFGPPAALVNNAARGTVYVREGTDGDAATFWQSDAERWAEAMETNVIGTFRMSVAAVPDMAESGFGRIVNISTSNRSMVRELNTPYGPSKAAVEAMSVAWARELEPLGVTVNVLLPGGAAATRMATGVTGLPLKPPEILNAAVLWLCSDDSSGHTGGRYIAADWDEALPPADAAAGARQPAHGAATIM